MTRLVNRVLRPGDLPLAELCAARLDGEVYSVDECFAAIDEVNTSLIRALALAALVPRGAIAELMTAAWVLGAVETPPSRHRFAVDVTHRGRTLQSHRFIVRECIVLEGDLTVIGGQNVTSPLRTAVDLLRTTAAFEAEHVEAVSALMRTGAITREACHARLRRQPTSPGMRRAIDRLDSLKLSSARPRFEPD
jgi:hypothetical protein